MSYTAKVYKVMIASPSDVTKERDIIKEVLNDWNAANAEKRKIILFPVGWETHSYPEFGARPQDIINKQILKGCDILIGVFWSRIGTSTGKYDSGTIEEIEEHIKMSKDTMLYFSLAPINPENIIQDQLNKVKEFQDKYKNGGLYSTYKDAEEFRKILVKHINFKMNDQKYFDQNPKEEFNNKSNNLSEIAKSILVEGSKDERGIVFRTPTVQGVIIQANHTNFPGSTTRESANLGAAIDQLEKEELIKDTGYKRQMFKLTEKGFKLIDNL